jgi:hypothetical protein
MDACPRCMRPRDGQTPCRACGDPLPLTAAWLALPRSATLERCGVCDRSRPIGGACPWCAATRASRVMLAPAYGPPPRRDHARTVTCAGCQRPRLPGGPCPFCGDADEPVDAEDAGPMLSPVYGPPPEFWPNEDASPNALPRVEPPALVTCAGCQRPRLPGGTCPFCGGVEEPIDAEDPGPMLSPVYGPPPEFWPDEDASPNALPLPPEAAKAPAPPASFWDRLWAALFGSR